MAMRPAGEPCLLFSASLHLVNSGHPLLGHQRSVFLFFYLFFEVQCRSSPRQADTPDGYVSQQFLLSAPGK